MEPSRTTGDSDSSSHFSDILIKIHKLTHDSSELCITGLRVQETEDSAEAVRKKTGEAKSKLNELVGNFESDISRLQAQIAKERKSYIAIQLLSVTAVIVSAL